MANGGNDGWTDRRMERRLKKRQKKKTRESESRKGEREHRKRKKGTTSGESNANGAKRFREGRMEGGNQTKEGRGGEPGGTAGLGGRSGWFAKKVEQKAESGGCNNCCGRGQKEMMEVGEGK